MVIADGFQRARRHLIRSAGSAAKFHVDERCAGSPRLDLPLWFELPGWCLPAEISVG
jgi:hypothetical protein